MLLQLFLEGIADVVLMIVSIMSAVVNVLGQKYKVPAPTITFTRSLFSLIICVIACFCIKVNPLGPYKEGKKFTWVVLRGLFGGIQITCYFFAFTQVGIYCQKCFSRNTLTIRFPSEMQPRLLLSLPCLLVSSPFGC